ncbi:MAG: hypothetical protein KDE50_00835 [Caldilineaceae bacterium]|nr:hypothetical protein [Caldilineaceae bacterium]MCB0138431.1 hypothetical protein [Caldilineaceae bacterium]
MDSFERQTQRAFDGCFFGLLSLIIGLIIKLISLTVGGTIGWLVSGVEKNPEDELRKLKSSLNLPKQIAGTTCPHCETLNEEYKTHCYACGLKLVESPKISKELSPRVNAAIALGTIFLIITIIRFPIWWNGVGPIFQTPTTSMSTGVSASDIALDIKQSKDRNQVVNTPESVTGNFLIVYSRGEGQDCNKVIGYLHPVLFSESEKLAWQNSCSRYVIELKSVESVKAGKPSIENGYEFVNVTAYGFFVAPDHTQNDITLKLARENREDAKWYIVGS